MPSRKMLPIFASLIMWLHSIHSMKASILEAQDPDTCLFFFFWMDHVPISKDMVMEVRLGQRTDIYNSVMELYCGMSCVAIFLC